MADLVGIGAGPVDAVGIASRAGFGGLDLRVNKFAEEIEAFGTGELASRMRDAGLRPGYCSATPQKIGVPEDEWRKGMDELPWRAGIARELGFQRATAVVLPFHDELGFEANAAVHVERVRGAADILAGFGISFGLEYVSPMTRRAGKANEFVWNLDGMIGLLERVDRPNVGVMLDCFHWQCAAESGDDIRRLRADQVVAVHVNDLIEGRPLEEQTVVERASAGETGLVDMDAFLRALVDIGYDGPVTAEPTNPKWQTMDASAAAEETARSIYGCFESAGVVSSASVSSDGSGS